MARGGRWCGGPYGAGERMNGAHGPENGVGVDALRVVSPTRFPEGMVHRYQLICDGG
jgi:hypothetical protein